MMLEGNFQERIETISNFLTQKKKQTKDIVAKVNSLTYLDSYDKTKTGFRFDDIPEINYDTTGISIEGPIRNYSIKMDDWAVGQLLARVGIPTSYFNRCPEWLKSTNFRYWSYVERDKKLLLRMWGENIRAVFSSRFNPELDDHILFPIVFNTLKDVFPVDGMQITSFEAENDYTVLKIALKDAKAEFNNNIAYASLVVINSEVGRSSVWIKPMVLSSHMSNLSEVQSFVDANREASMSFRHVGDLSKERITEALKEAYRAAQIGVHRVLEMSQQTVANPALEIDKLVESGTSLNKRMFAVLRIQLEEETEVNRLDLARELLNAVRNLPLFFKQKAEEDIGRHLNLFRGLKTRMETVLSDIEKV